MAHTSEKLDYTVTAFIVFKNKVLLIYNKRYHKWFPPGGHIDKDEDLENALYREIEEETGYKKNDLKIVDFRNSLPNEDLFSDMKGRSIITPTFTDTHEASIGHIHYGFRYFFKTRKNIKLTSHDDYVIKHKWFSREDLKNSEFNLRKHVVWYATFALSHIK